VIENHVAAIQACFPEVYFACHTRHATQADAPKGLTQRDGTLLAHIAGLQPVESGELARHLGRAKSTLSAAIQKLVRMGLITASPPAGDARRKILAVTAEGRACIAKSSVLETPRLTAALGSMPERDRETAVRGLQLLAAACRRLMKEKGK
jgi:DNA-binding MarR family transcriptional regulator